MEFASFFSNIGVEVHVVEMMEEIVPIMDADFAKLLRKSIRNISYHLGAKVEAIHDDTVVFSSTGNTESIQADRSST